MPAAAASFSVWVAPPAATPLSRRLRAEIDAAAARVPGAPPFPPHLTLVGGVPEMEEAAARRAAAALAAELAPFEVELDHVAAGRAFYQCVYILAKRSPAVVAASAAARAAFGLDSAEHFMAHVSVVYSDADLAERERLAAELQGRLFGGGADALPSRAFAARELELWRTDGEVARWERVAALPLTGGGGGGGD
jgi:2'-5' RNA ligase